MEHGKFRGSFRLRFPAKIPQRASFDHAQQPLLIASETYALRNDMERALGLFQLQKLLSEAVSSERDNRTCSVRLLTQCVRERDLVLLARLAIASERRKDTGKLAVIIRQCEVVWICDVERRRVLEQCVFEPPGLPEIEPFFG
jgi:hypothetical protein